VTDEKGTVKPLESENIPSSLQRFPLIRGMQIYAVQAKRTPLGVLAYRPAVAGMDDRSAQIPHLR